MLKQLLAFGKELICDLYAYVHHRESWYMDTRPKTMGTRIKKY